ncbi:MAG: flippase-like domain-containing protein [Candidatus Thiodiazotropha sp. (ex Ctena orbiculata)]|nr:flippase-like domain-containing protein [Candidatus Thiodiazotropha taylori]
MQTKLKTALKTLWWVVVLCFIFVFLHGNLHVVDDVVKQIPIGIIISSLLSLTLGKLLLVAIMHQSLRYYKIDFRFLQSFSIYNITQLGKYIPGSIWQFVGKIGMYKSARLDSRSVRDTIVLETFWVVFSAFMFGLLLIGFTQYQFLITLSHKVPTVIPIATLAIILFLLLLPQLRPHRERLYGYCRRLLFTPLSFMTALLIWLTLGFAFWITLTPFTTSEIGLVYIIGLYAFSYAVGFAVPFAPAGIGIRESVLVLGLAPFLDVNSAIILAALNRIFYIFIEIILSALSIMVSGRRSVDRPKT